MSLAARIAALEARRGASAASAGIITFDPFSETPEEAVARARPGTWAVVPAAVPAERWEGAVVDGQRRLATMIDSAIRGEAVEIGGPFG